MGAKEKKYSRFIEDLKSSNIASNITSLNFYSEQIKLLLDQIKPDDDTIVKANLLDAKKVIENTINKDELIEYYIKFGDIYKSMLPDLRNGANIKYLKKIAIHYLDVAKLTKDDRIKNLAFAIADKFSE